MNKIDEREQVIFPTIPISVAASHMISGDIELTDTEITLDFDAITYTGNGTSQDIVTGLSTIDFTQALNGSGFYHDRVAGDGIVMSDSATELVTNGTFDTDITSWGTGNATLSLVSNTIRVTNDGATTNGYTVQSITGLTIGKSYLVSGDFIAGTSTGGGRLYLGDTITSVTTSQTITNVVVASATSMNLYLQISSVTTGHYADFDNISVKEVSTSGSIAFKDVAGVDGVCEVYVKNLTVAESNLMYDSIRNGNLYTDATNAEDTTDYLTPTTTGFTLNSASGITNRDTNLYIAYVTLYTHIAWGLTNHGKRYIVAYNPVTNKTLPLYIGSGLAGHEIPHFVNAKLDLVHMKNLDSTVSWISQRQPYLYMYLNETDAETTVENLTVCTDLGINSSTLGNNAIINGLDQTHIMQGRAKSKTWTIVPYVGTGVTGNFIETLDVDGVARKPRRVIFKAIEGVYGWPVHDSKRDTDGTQDSYIFLDASDAEATDSIYDIVFKANGVTIDTVNQHWNEENKNYIALVEFDSQLSTTLETLEVL